MSITITRISPMYETEIEEAPLPFDLPRQAIHHKDIVTRYEWAVIALGFGLFTGGTALLVAIFTALWGAASVQMPDGEHVSSPAFPGALLGLLAAVLLLCRPLMERARDRAGNAWEKASRKAQPKLAQFITGMSGASEEEAMRLARFALYNPEEDFRDGDRWHPANALHAARLGTKRTRHGSFLRITRWVVVPGTDPAEQCAAFDRD